MTEAAENAARRAPRLTPEQAAYMGKYLGPPMGGRWGGRSTRSQNVELADIFKGGGYDVIGGGGSKPEEWIPGPDGGTKGGTFVDIALRGPNGEILRIQTVTTEADGTTPKKSEQAAAGRIRQRFPKDRLLLVPKRVTPKPTPPPPKDQSK
jgi:filamentous hemagglutinin